MMRFPLKKNGQTVGEVHVDIRNTDVLLSASCEETLDGIWRAYLTDGSREWLIGVMEPRGDFFMARKKLSHIRMNIENLFGKLVFDRMVELSDLRWIPYETFPNAFLDDILQTAVKRGNGILIDSAKNPTRIAFPLSGECAFAPMLCLARMMELSGRLYAVLGIDEKGNPVTFKA